MRCLPGSWGCPAGGRRRPSCVAGGTASWAAGGRPGAAAPASPRPPRRCRPRLLAVLHALGRVALLLGRERRRPGGRVVADHVELLAHRPQVRGGPVQEHADRERDAADREHHGQHVEQHLLLLGVRAGEGVGRHVLAHQLALGEERGAGHRHHEHGREDHHRGVAVVVEERQLDRDLPNSSELAERLGQVARRGSRAPCPSWRPGRASGTAPGRSASAPGSAGTRRTGWCPCPCRAPSSPGRAARGRGRTSSAAPSPAAGSAACCGWT